MQTPVGASLVSVGSCAGQRSLMSFYIACVVVVGEVDRIGHGDSQFKPSSLDINLEATEGIWRL